MIAKNIKGKSFKGCVQYVMNETAEPTQEREQSYIYMSSTERQGGRRSQLLEAEGVFTDSTQSIIRSFAMQRSGRKEIIQPVGHIPISFSPEDKRQMTNDFMLQLAKEYMQEMGIKNTQYIIVRHHNTDNDHLHIVYNRIDNKLKLISVNQDYKPNIKVCKKLKDKYNLTYGKGKENVKREKLDNPDRVKYYIYDAIKSVLPTCKNPADLRFGLQKFIIEIDYKFKRTTREIEGVSFKYDNVCFKGSEIDRKFSFGSLKKAFEQNIEEVKKRGREEYLQQQVEQKVGSFIFLENMTNKDTKVQFSSYVFLNEEKDKAFFSKNIPDDFVKYGQYEMHIRDKILIENGYVAKAKVKWWGGGFAYPYLWKANKSDTEYKESWSDPRLPKTQKEEVKRQIVIPKIKKNRGRKW